MSIYSDFKKVAENDVRHKRLAMVSTAWLRYPKFNVDVQYDTDGITPLSGLVTYYKPQESLLIRKTSVCPIDSNADFQFMFWVGDLRKRKAKLESCFVKNCLSAEDTIIKKGAGNIWGAVPPYSKHLIEFLNRMHADGAIERYDPNKIKDRFERPEEIEHIWFNKIIYVGNKETTKAWLQSQ